MHVMGYGAAIKIVRTQLKRRLIAFEDNSLGGSNGQAQEQPLGDLLQRSVRRRKIVAIFNYLGITTPASLA